MLKKMSCQEDIPKIFLSFQHQGTLYIEDKLLKIGADDFLTKPYLSCILHKNIQNKVSHVLIGEGKELFEFLDRGENPANCHLYKCNMQTNRLLLTPQRYEERLTKEDVYIEKYSDSVDEKFSGSDKP